MWRPPRGRRARPTAGALRSRRQASGPAGMHYPVLFSPGRLAETLILIGRTTERASRITPCRPATPRRQTSAGRSVLALPRRQGGKSIWPERVGLGRSLRRRSGPGSTGGAEVGHEMVKSEFGLDEAPVTASRFPIQSRNLRRFSCAWRPVGRDSCLSIPRKVGLPVIGVFPNGRVREFGSSRSGGCRAPFSSNLLVFACFVAPGDPSSISSPFLSPTSWRPRLPS